MKKHFTTSLALAKNYYSVVEIAELDALTRSYQIYYNLSISIYSLFLSHLNVFIFLFLTLYLSFFSVFLSLSLLLSPFLRLPPFRFASYLFSFVTRSSPIPQSSLFHLSISLQNSRSLFRGSRELVQYFITVVAKKLCSSANHTHVSLIPFRCYTYFSYWKTHLNVRPQLDLLIVAAAFFLYPTCVLYQSLISPILTIIGSRLLNSLSFGICINFFALCLFFSRFSFYFYVSLAIYILFMCSFSILLPFLSHYLFLSLFSRILALYHLFLSFSLFLSIYLFFISRLAAI